MSAPRTRRIQLIALASLSLALGACAAYLGKNALYSGDLIRVPHARHAAAKVECVSCHEEIYDSPSLNAGKYRPPEDKCMECHREQKDAGKCTMCHTDPKNARPYPERQYELVFSHKNHIERTKEDCKVCHAQLPDPVRSPQLAPPMAVCLECHEHRKDYDEGRCDRCHTDLARYPLKPVASFSHEGNFVRNHAKDARAAVDRCATCHDQTFCSDCHAKTVSTPIEMKYSERVLSDFIHRNDFLSRHSLEASADPASCRRCHGSSFCEGCHTAQNLTPLAANPRNPHPPGWTFPGAGEFHGTEARKDITACAACHDQGAKSVCVDCHKVGGAGGNPHPTGFTDRHPHAEITKNSMCLYCHQ